MKNIGHIIGWGVVAVGFVYVVSIYWRANVRPDTTIHNRNPFVKGDDR